MESASSGLLAGYNLARILKGKEPVDFTDQTVMGALAHYISRPVVRDFQPMNATFGIVAPLGKRIRNKREKNQAVAERALETLRIKLTD